MITYLDRLHKKWVISAERNGAKKYWYSQNLGNGSSKSGLTTNINKAKLYDTRREAEICLEAVSFYPAYYKSHVYRVEKVFAE